MCRRVSTTRGCQGGKPARLGGCLMPARTRPADAAIGITDRFAIQNISDLVLGTEAEKLRNGVTRLLAFVPVQAADPPEQPCTKHRFLTLPSGLAVRKMSRMGRVSHRRAQPAIQAIDGCAMPNELQPRLR